MKEKKMIQNIIGVQGYNNLETLVISKEEYLFSKDCYIIEKGQLELFFLSKESQSIKLINHNQFSYSLIGLSSFFSNLNFEFEPYYIASTNVVLKKIPYELFQKLLDDNKFNRWFIETSFKYTSEILSYFFSLTTLKKEKKVKYLLQKESNGLKSFKLNRMNNFIEKYNLSRSNLYKYLSKLEEDKEIKKTGKYIKFLIHK